MADDYAALGQQLFNIPVAAIRSKVKPDSVAGDRGEETDDYFFDNQ